MAVFPSARRALLRPARLSWLVTAAALFTISLTVPLATGLLDSSGSVESLKPLVTDSRVDPDSSGISSPEAETADNARLLTSDQENALFEAMASDVLLASEEASFALALPPAPITEAPGESVQAAGAVAEVSAEPVRNAPEPFAEPALSGTTEPSTGAPASNTQPAVQAAPAAPPVQAAPVVPGGPIQRWAGAGIVIETQGQALDDMSLANVDAALSVLPPSVLSNLGNPAFGPLHILVNTEGRVRSGDQPYGGPANFFSTNEGTNELVLYPQQSVFTIVHELGHAYNLRRIAAGRYAMVLMDPEMRGFLDATGWLIGSTDEQISTAVDHMHVAYSYSGSFHWPRLSNDDPLEDFANTFAMYFLDPASLQQMSHARYAWMAATFGN